MNINNFNRYLDIAKLALRKTKTPTLDNVLITEKEMRASNLSQHLVVKNEFPVQKKLFLDLKTLSRVVKELSKQHGDENFLLDEAYITVNGQSFPVISDPNADKFPPINIQAEGDTVSITDIKKAFGIVEFAGEKRIRDLSIVKMNVENGAFTTTTTNGHMLCRYETPCNVPDFSVSVENATAKIFAKLKGEHTLFYTDQKIIAESDYIIEGIRVDTTYDDPKACKEVPGLIDFNFEAMLRLLKILQPRKGTLDEHKKKIAIGDGIKLGELIIKNGTVAKELVFDGRYLVQILSFLKKMKAKDAALGFTSEDILYIVADKYEFYLLPIREHI